MRTLDGRLLVDLGDKSEAYISSSIQSPSDVGVDENATEYSLFPVDLNNVPVITRSVLQSSNPKIIREETHKPNQKLLCLFENNIIKAAVNSSFKLAVIAQQPNVLNVENGKPIIISPNTNLTYTWTKDGDVIGGYIKLSEGNITVDQNTLTFTGIGTDAAGAYTCQVSNDIGSVTTETLTLEVHNPASTFDEFFGKNLVQNPFGETDTDSWTNVVGSIRTKSFLKSKAKELAVNTQLKTANSNIAEYVPEQFYPYPKNVEILNLENYNLLKIHTNDAKYFTRENFNYLTQGGTDIVIAYQDIDLTAIQDYIKGKILGVDGVKAVFSCYIGNAISTYLPTKEVVIPENRYKAQNYNLQKPRLDVENILRSGPPAISETIKVFVQEYDNNTPLTSRIIDESNYEIKSVNGLSFIDPVQKTLRYVREQLLPESVYPVDTLFGGSGQSLSADSPINQILRAYQQLYPTLDQYYTFGQYVEFNKAFFDKLNYKTNKIRISLQFEVDALTLSDIWQTTKGADAPLEYPGWQKPYQYLGFDLLDRDDEQQIYNLSEVAKNPKYANAPLSKKAFSFVNPRGLVTALNLAVYPITSTFYNVIGYNNTQFVQNVVKTPTKERDLTTRYVSPSPYLASPPPPALPVQTVFYKWRITQSRNAMPRNTFPGITIGIPTSQYVYRTRFELFRRTAQGEYEQVPIPNASSADNIFRFQPQRYTINYQDASALTTQIPPVTELDYIQNQRYLDDTYPSNDLTSLKLNFTEGFDVPEFVNNRETILKTNGITGVGTYQVGNPGSQLFPTTSPSTTNRWLFNYNLRKIDFKPDEATSVNILTPGQWVSNAVNDQFLEASNEDVFFAVPNGIDQPEDWRVVDGIYVRKEDGVPQLPKWIWSYPNLDKPYVGTLNVYDYEVVYDYKEINRR